MNIAALSSQRGLFISPQFSAVSADTEETTKAAIVNTAATVPMLKTQRHNEKIMNAFQTGKGGIPYSQFFIIGGMIAAGSMSIRGLIEGVIPWLWSFITGF